MLKGSPPVKHCKMISSKCKTIFHEDFKMTPKKCNRTIDLSSCYQRTDFVVKSINWISSDATSIIP